LIATSASSISPGLGGTPAGTLVILNPLASIVPRTVQGKDVVLLTLWKSGANPDIVENS
jgi:hypothetical protein